MILEITEFKTIFDIIKRFPTEQDCIDHLEKLRWDGNVVSPFDADSTVYKCKGNKYKCRNTGLYFNVRTGTIFGDSKIPFQKWFMALFIFSSHKKGISSHQLSKDIGITQKSAWFLLHRLRYAFDHPMFKETLGNEVEIDETYMGGDEANKHSDKKTEGSQGRSLKAKKPVLGMIERGGNLIALVVPDTKGATLQPHIKANVSKSSIIMTDEWGAYNGLGKTFKHLRVNHSANEYVNGMAHTNSVEGFWSHLKRGIDGIYHWCSQAHLQAYVNEFTLRYNTRESQTAPRFNMILQNANGKRLTYKKLINHE